MEQQQIDNLFASQDDISFEEEETQEILSLINQFKKQNDTPRSFEIINHVIISLIKKGILFNLSTILKHL